MKKPVATIILNRNLPKVTNKLYRHIKKYDGDYTDIFVVEAGSDPNNLSRYCTWHASWSSAKKKGLRYNRGMNYALSELWKNNNFYNYQGFFLITNDTELYEKSTINTLLKIIEKNNKIGILSPCSKKWEERKLIKANSYKFFWHITNNAYFLKTKFLSKILNSDKPDYKNFIFDGNNFRGYGTETELIAKGYANDYASAITRSVWAEENENYLKEKVEIIKTENYDRNLELYLKEGLKWMKVKYGFNSKWDMTNYAKIYYDAFFRNYPEQIDYKL